MRRPYRSRRASVRGNDRVDADRVELTEALRRFTRRSAGADVSLIFFAGRGIKSDGVNYLAPVDRRVERDLDGRYETVTVDDLFARRVRADPGVWYWGCTARRLRVLSRVTHSSICWRLDLCWLLWAAPREADPCALVRVPRWPSRSTPAGGSGCWRCRGRRHRVAGNPWMRLRSMRTKPACGGIPVAARVPARGGRWCQPAADPLAPGGVSSSRRQPRVGQARRLAGEHAGAPRLSSMPPTRSQGRSRRGPARRACGWRRGRSWRWRCSYMMQGSSTICVGMRSACDGAYWTAFPDPTGRTARRW